MKHFSAKARKHKAAHSSQRQPDQAGSGTFWLPRGLVIVLCLLLAGGSTWAVFEFVIWNTLPPALVGKWIVVGGKQDGDQFNFSRSGHLEAHFDKGYQTDVLLAKVVVEDNKMLVTTRNPKTGLNETRTCLIKELTAKSLVVEFEKGEVFRMIRAQ